MSSMHLLRKQSLKKYLLIAHYYKVTFSSVVKNKSERQLPQKVSFYYGDPLWFQFNKHNQQHCAQFYHGKQDRRKRSTWVYFHRWSHNYQRYLLSLHGVAERIGHNGGKEASKPTEQHKHPAFLFSGNWSVDWFNSATIVRRLEKLLRSKKHQRYCIHGGSELFFTLSYY